MILSVPEPISPSSARQLLWPSLLVIPSIVASAALACVAPFAAVAALAGLTLSRGEAIATVLAMWFGSQAVGYVFLGYSWSADSLLWGLVIGAATVIAAVAARHAPGRSRSGAMRLAIGGVAAFAVYELLLWSASFVLGGAENFSAAVIGEVAQINALWALGLAAGHVVLSMRARRSPLSAVPFIGRTN